MLVGREHLTALRTPSPLTLPFSSCTSGCSRRRVPSVTGMKAHCPFLPL